MIYPVSKRFFIFLLYLAKSMNTNPKIKMNNHLKGLEK